MRSAPTLVAAKLAVLLCGPAFTIDKNGVAPQAISLPSGPGSIQGLGESFQPQLNSGSGSTAVKLLLPRGPGGITPELSLAYNSGGGNGPLGLGWSLQGLLSVRRNTDRGVPLYVEGPDGIDNDLDGAVDNPEELDTFTGLGGEELVALEDRSFRAESEASFFRYTRSGDGWEARGRDGRRYVFGMSAQARIEEAGRVFEWLIERLIDPNGNTIEYEYLLEPPDPLGLPSAQKHLRRLRWAGAVGGEASAGAYLAAVLAYEEGRPDVTTSYRSGFAVRTSLRLRGIDIISHGLPAPAGALRADLDGDGSPDTLLRRYRFRYQPGLHVSLLTLVTQLGYDGATALPTLTYGYTSWTPPDNVSAALIRSSSAPPEGFDSPSVELIDLNGDALPDLLSTTGSQHRVYLNLGIDSEGRLAWAPGRPVGNAPAIDISSDRTHLADATANGLSDLMVKVSNTSFLCFDNTGEGSWTTAPLPIRNTDTWPIWPYDGQSGAMSRSFDSDYSRTNDILHAGASGVQLWFFLPGGRYSRELRLPPLVCDGLVFRFDLPGTRIADLNGDRIQDLVWIQPTRVAYFPNRGRGSFGEPIIFNLGRTLTAAEIERCGFSDIDGDGLVDLTLVRPASEPNGVLYWLNRFERGLEGPRVVRGLPAQRTGDDLRWADMNGNGTTDIVISQAQSEPGEKIIVIDLVPEGKPFLLREIENGLGLRIRMDYESSTAQMVRAEAAGEPWSRRMPVAVTVVSRIEEDDGLSPPYVQSISYRDPHWDPEKQEFRGFEGAEAREEGDSTAPAKRARFVFDTGREEPCLKGKQLSEEVLGADGKLFSRSLTRWRARVLAEGIDGRRVCFAEEEAMDRFVHEGEPEGVHIRSESDHDDFGNVVAERRLGIHERAGDEVLIEREYDIRLASWRLDLLRRETTRDGAGNRLAERRLFYDERGNLERQEAWLEEEERFIAELRQRFDAFGNVVEKIDARGSRRSIDYDPLIHAFAVRETVHLGSRDLEMAAEYDLALGVVTSSVDFSGERSEYLYDALSRLVEKRRPGGAGESYEYQLGAPVSRTVKRGRETGGGTLDAYVFYDGRGRELLTKLEAEEGKWRVMGAKAFNARKLEGRSWIPYLSSSDAFEVPDPALPHTALTYDAPGRLVETLAPDGSRTRTEHRPLEALQYDGEDLAGGGSPDLRRADGLERLMEVEERDGAERHTTRYRWNARGELQSITDALGNVKRFRFDSLSRLVEVDDPDRGLLRQVYDDAGNLIERRDAKGQVVAFTYDAANRPLTKLYRGAGPGGADLVETRQHYDLPAGVLDFGDGTSAEARHTAGRLSWAEDRSGETHFSYDERGNVEWVLKRVRDQATGLLIPYRTERRYDLLDRETAVVFPDGDLLGFEYGQGSFVRAIGGEGAGAKAILLEAEHSASGRPLRLRWGNGLETRCEYDRNDRLRSDRLLAGAGALWHDELTYDLASNLTAIDDQRPLAAVPESSPRRRTARFAYDELHRLKRASYGAGGSGGIIDYRYDAIGNLLEQRSPPAGQPGHLSDPNVALGAVSYAGGRKGRGGRRPGDPPGPHALTGTQSGKRLSYDANGNVSRLDGAELGWDHEDRLERFSGSGAVADYVHDHSGRRVIRRVARINAVEEVWQIDAASEVRQEGGAETLVKYAFLDGRRVARIEGRLSPARESIQRLRLAGGWNLVSAAVETGLRLREAFGSAAAVYEATGPRTYAPVSLETTLLPGRALWVHVPEARVVALRGRERKLAGDIASPGPLHAWPRLEAFRPAVHLREDPALLVFDAVARRWLRRDASLPSFLSDAPAELGSAQSFWSEEAVRFRAEEAASSGLVFYHADALGSIALQSDGSGALIEERSHYPYGAVRHLHRPGVALAGTEHDFTGHERDRESGLIHMAARSYLDLAGIFLSPDPRFAAAAALGGGSERDRKSFASFLSNPQMGNLYAHALRNPLKYTDPEGLEVRASNALQSDRLFQQGWRAFKATPTGQDLLKRIEKQGGKIFLQTGDFSSQRSMLRIGPTSKLDFNLEARMGTVQIDMAAHLSRAQFNPAEAANSIARDIHKELRTASRIMILNDLGSQLLESAKANLSLPEGEAFDAQRDELARDFAVNAYFFGKHAKYFLLPDKAPVKAQFEAELTAPVKVK
jgi:RHS repeat-associated protein